MQALNETLMASNERMKDMDKVKTDFITITSHELRTPLTQIIGFSDLLNMMSEDESVSGAQLRDVTDSMIKSCNRLNEVVTQMLDVSQTDVDALRLKFVETDMESVLRGAVEPYIAAIQERKLSLSVQRVRGLPRFSGDPKRLSQALGQVVSNAIKYTPDGGRIEISFKYVARDPQRGESIEIIVADAGVGINPKHLESIFEKFFRVGSAALHSTGTTKFMGGGPGLGLAIAKGIVEGHGGKIWAESSGYDMEKLPGTQIHIILPIKPAPFATKPSSAAFIGVDAQGNLPEIKV
jgi:signal transduction histidine kinase